MSTSNNNKTIKCKDCSKEIRQDKYSSHLFTNHKELISNHIKKIGRIILPIEYQCSYLCMVCNKAFPTKVKALRHIETNPDTCSIELQTKTIVSLLAIEISDSINVTFNTLGVSQKKIQRAENTANHYATIVGKNQDKLEYMTAELSIANQRINSLNNEKNSLKNKSYTAESQLALLNYIKSKDKEIYEAKLEFLIGFIETLVYNKKIPDYDIIFCKKQIAEIDYDEDELAEKIKLEQQIKYNKDNGTKYTDIHVMPEPEPKPQPVKSKLLDNKGCAWCNSEINDLYNCTLCKKLKHRNVEEFDCFSYNCLECDTEFCYQCCKKLYPICTQLTPICSKVCYLNYKKKHPDE